MKLFLTHPDFPNRVASSSAVMTMLGLKPGGHLPREGMPARELQGILVWVKPADTDPERRQRAPHRVFAKCPACGKEVPVGRLSQHATVHTLERAIKDAPEQVANRPSRRIDEPSQT